MFANGKYNKRSPPLGGYDLLYSVGGSFFNA